jgi:hypothetical protein
MENRVFFIDFALVENISYCNIYILKFMFRRSFGSSRSRFEGISYPK